ncbi:MAG: hypothetical protein AAFX55_15670 [Bacteroidota bacterium]
MKKDHIEDLYNDLKDFSKEPPSELWDHIEARLHPKKKRRGVFWLWGSAAAILVVFVGYMLSNWDNNNGPIKEITDIEHTEDHDTIDEFKDRTKIINEAVTITEDEETLPDTTNNKGIIDNVENQKQRSHQNLVKQKAQKKNLAEHSIEKPQDKKEETSKFDRNYAIASQEEAPKKSAKEAVSISKDELESAMDSKEDKGIAHNDSIPKPKEPALLDISEVLMAENESTKDTLNTGLEGVSKWSVEALGGLSNTASDASFQGTMVNTTSQNNFVYTVRVGYALTNRLVVKSGIGNNVLGQEINNIGYLSADTPLLSGGPQNIISNQDIFFVASPGFASQDGSSETTTDFGTLEQQFNYLQIPLEFSYKVLNNQKYALSLGIGGNVNFLTDNRAFLDGEQIGESLGVEATVFGATLNSNLSYQLTKQMNLFVEPSYNYFQKPVNTTNQEFSNTQLRILFGLRYKL